MSDTHQWEVEISGQVIGVIHFSTEYYTGPFDPGSNAIVVDLKVKNTGDKDGNIYWKLFEYPNSPQEQLLDSDQIFCAYSSAYCNYGSIMILIPTGLTIYPLGIKVWGEDETEPSWGQMGTSFIGKQLEMPIILRG